jgi:GrpB-like predicted nucleotidyltransferase (UPF0157 family)
MNEQIIIFEYDANWKNIFEKERDLINSIIGEYIEQIEHSGSTSVDGLAAKPIIDITIGIRKLSDAIHCIPKLEKLNYEYVPKFEKELPMRRYFRKPPKGSGKRKFHIHMVEITSDFWKDQIDFRDYLRKNKTARDDYARLKYELAEKYKDDRSAYTDAKTEFVNEILELARK